MEREREREREKRERQSTAGRGAKKKESDRGKKDQGREEWRGGEERPEVRIEKCERSERREEKPGREGGPGMCPPDAWRPTTFEDGQKRSGEMSGEKQENAISG